MCLTARSLTFESFTRDPPALVQGHTRLQKQLHKFMP